MIALHERKYDESISAFTKAVRTEENMVYNEPRDWLLNPKHYLGFAYLESARFTEAEKVLREDLQNNNDNVWALKGLRQALSGQRKTRDVLKLMPRLNAAEKKADLKVNSPIF